MTKEKRKSSRVRLIPLHKILFDFQGERMTLSNLSETGLAIERKLLPKIVEPDQIFDSKIEIENKVFEFKIQFVHSSQNYLGFKILNPTEDYKDAFLHIFFKEILATKMKEVNFERVKQDPAGKTRWWSGGEDCDFVLVTGKQGVIKRFELVFFGNLIQGGEKVPVRIGEINERPDRFKSFSGSQILGDSRVINERIGDALIKFLFNLEGVDEETINKLAQILNQHSRAA